MTAKIFLTPFAKNGDVLAVPDARQPDGKVSYDAGFSPDYDRQLGVDPQAKNILRTNFNNLIGAATQSLQEFQSGAGMPPFTASLAAALVGGGYPQGALIPRTDNRGFWQSLIAANSVDPTTTTTGWIPVDVIGTFTQALSNVNVTLSSSNAAFTVLILTGALTSNVLVTLPAWGGYAWTVDNRCTGGFTVTAATPAGTPVTLSNGVITGIFCDGVNVKQGVAVAQATETVQGTAKVATQALVALGADDTTFITPKKLAAAVQASFGRIVADTGTANTIVANFTPAITSPVQDGEVITVIIAASNSGPTTLNASATGATAVVGLGGVALQGGELTAGSRATFMFAAGSGWYLLYSQAAALQVGTATKSSHAMQLGQAVGRLLRTTTYINVGGVLQSSVNGSAYAVASAIFVPLAATTAVDVEAQASGGSGGGAAAVSAGQIAAGSGGGAGGYARGIFTSAFSGVTVTVGAARSGTAGTGGVTGQSSSFGGMLSTTGGGGGALGTAASVTNSPAGGAAGGIGSGGYLNVQGGFGGYSFYSTNPVSGSGGSSMFGAGAAYVSGTFGGLSSVNYGSGGGGASLVGSSSAATGGASAGGFVIIREYML